MKILEKVTSFQFFKNSTNDPQRADSSTVLHKSGKPEKIKNYRLSKPDPDLPKTTVPVQDLKKQLLKAN